MADEFMWLMIHMYIICIYIYICISVYICISDKTPGSEGGLNTHDRNKDTNWRGEYRVRA